MNKIGKAIKKEKSKSIKTTLFPSLFITRLYLLVFDSKKAGRRQIITKKGKRPCG
jgi:hypothetical protein